MTGLEICLLKQGASRAPGFFILFYLFIIFFVGARYKVREPTKLKITSCFTKISRSHPGSYEINSGSPREF